MVLLYLSEMCEQGRHDMCDGGNKPSPGTMGGSKCTCPCHNKEQAEFDLDVTPASDNIGDGQ